MAELTDEQIAEEEKFLEGIPRLNVGALFAPPIWGPVHGLWVTIGFYPLMAVGRQLLLSGMDYAHDGIHRDGGGRIRLPDGYHVPVRADQPAVRGPSLHRCKRMDEGALYCPAARVGGCGRAYRVRRFGGCNLL